MEIFVYTILKVCLNVIFCICQRLLSMIEIKHTSHTWYSLWAIVDMCEEYVDDDIKFIPLNIQLYLLRQRKAYKHSNLKFPSEETPYIIWNIITWLIKYEPKNNIRWYSMPDDKFYLMEVYTCTYRHCARKTISH